MPAERVAHAQGGFDMQGEADRIGGAIEQAPAEFHAEAIEAGLLEARQVLPLDESEIDEIIDAFERCHTVDSGKLGPAHAALEGRYDYGILKCVLAELA